jgi:hypothetical protein
MKRKDLLKQVEKRGCILIRHGGKHDWYQNPKTKVSHFLLFVLEAREQAKMAEMNCEKTQIVVYYFYGNTDLYHQTHFKKSVRLLREGIFATLRWTVRSNGFEKFDPLWKTYKKRT